MDALWDGLRWAFGVGVEQGSLNTLQVCLRGLLVYLGGFAILRLGDRRFLGKSTVFDVILGFVLGSILSRAVNGNAPLVPTLVVSALLVALHWAMAAAALRHERLSDLLKGDAELLVRDGQVDERAMRRNQIGRRDLEEALRSAGHVSGPEGVREARLERNGQISVLPTRREPRVIEVAVEEGVQRVRIELG